MAADSASRTASAYWTAALMDIARPAVRASTYSLRSICPRTSDRASSRRSRRKCSCAAPASSKKAFVAWPADPSATVDYDRSGLPYRGESVIAALTLAVVSGHTDDAAALAPPHGRSPLDVCQPERPAADQARDPRARAPAGAGESALGLPA